MVKVKHNPIIKGRGGRDQVNGATCKGDKFMHLGEVSGETACKKGWDNFLMTYDEVEITCPDCIKSIMERANQ